MDAVIGIAQRAELPFKQDAAPGGERSIQVSARVPHEGREDLGAQTCARMFSGRIADLSRSNVQRVCAVGAQPDSRIWQR